MQDNYIQEFDAKIIEMTDESLILNQTAFYPEGGGQIGDIGQIERNSKILTITGTAKREGKVHHFFEGNSPFSVGDVIHGKLDWKQRYECMRFHTAQHVLSRYLQLNYNAETVGNHIGYGESRADYSPLDAFDDEMKNDVQNGVNEILKRNLEVRLEFMPREEAISFLNSKGYQVRYLEMVPESVKIFRIISVDDYDAASCAGTHVRNTSEIGEIRLGKTKNVGSGKRRLYFSLSI